MSEKKKYISFDEALQKLQRYCAYQDRCHQEVRTKLLNLGIYGDELEKIIVLLIEERFLDEERFARSFARGKFRIKQWGRQRIVRELKMRNISAYCIKKALEEIEEEAYAQTLEQVINKKAGALREKNAFKRNQKLAQHAMRRGFESNLIWEYIKKMDG